MREQVVVREYHGNAAFGMAQDAFYLAAIEPDSPAIGF